jgi:hypothetical protein
MHTLDKLERAIAAVEQLGYRVRQEWLGAAAGGGSIGSGDCEIRGQKWLFLDLSQSPADQLDVVTEVLRREAADRQAQAQIRAETPNPLRKSA